MAEQPKQDRRVQVSAALIVRDEAPRLRRCLESLKGVADEIVVVDTGSVDDTVAVAREYTDRVFFFSWEDDFAAARNCSIEHAAGEYVLAIDADTEIENRQEARALLDRFMRQHDGGVAGTAEVTSPQGVGPEANTVVVSLQVFFRRDLFRYTGAVHEQLALISGGMHRVTATGLRYAHSGYALDAAEMRRKTQRNMRILRRELMKRPGDAYYLYQLGKAHFSLQEYAAAAAGFERALDAIQFTVAGPAIDRSGRPVAADTLTDLVVSLAYAYANTNRVQAAAALLDTHRRIGHPGTESADFSYALGYVHIMLGDVPRAKAAYAASLDRGPAREQVRGTGSYGSHYHLGLLCEAEGKLPAALEHYGQALRAKPDYAPAIARCVDFITEYGMRPEAALWGLAEPKTLVDVYRRRLGTCVETGSTEQARLLVEAAAAISTELSGACAAVRGNPDREGDTNAPGK